MTVIGTFCYLVNKYAWELFTVIKAEKAFPIKEGVCVHIYKNLSLSSEYTLFFFESKLNAFECN